MRYSDDLQVWSFVKTGYLGWSAERRKDAGPSTSPLRRYKYVHMYCCHGHELRIRVPYIVAKTTGDRITGNVITHQLHSVLSYRRGKKRSLEPCIRTGLASDCFRSAASFCGLPAAELENIVQSRRRGRTAAGCVLV